MCISDVYERAAHYRYHGRDHPEHEPGREIFKVQQLYIPKNEKLEPFFISVIGGVNEALKLVNHWNRTDQWHYYLEV